MAVSVGKSLGQSVPVYTFSTCTGFLVRLFPGATTTRMVVVDDGSIFEVVGACLDLDLPDSAVCAANENDPPCSARSRLLLVLDQLQ